ncbi:hypothetical protein ANCCEY_13730 [Ancylostoma ceylanicum]|uniref:Reverse transcriptase domain-containing protein n=1 Tax=Ancylostoma ceylanicum TaxID=53326 RepID=A0A0D6LBI2_9BILA|nr:hypothetical protein ANCCEY_13730 [Ancylostoma ceylanicum]
MVDQKVNILLSTPAMEKVEIDSPIPVCVAETTVLHQSAETFVHCYSEIDDNTIFLLSVQSPQLSQMSLMVPPAVFNEGIIRLLVSNPTRNVEMLYEDQQISSDMRDHISRDSYDLGSYEESEIVITITTEVPPTRFRPPRIPIKFQKELDEHINKLLRAGGIVESDTPWIHNTVLVKKKDDSLRVCLDFRPLNESSIPDSPLNESTIPDHYPLPRTDDILAKITGHRYYTTLDLASGYMQLLFSLGSQEKCGWATHIGIYQFVYLPFGLKNAGTYFSRAMS